MGLELFSLSTAVQLATGAYGWYKAKERSQSLRQLLSTKGRDLVSTSTFNYHNYKNIRNKHGPMRGVAAQDQSLLTTTLPKASTAVPEDPGLACLRALTTGILCLFDVDGAVEILRNVAPVSLIQLHQEDATLEVEGSLLACLKQWVSAVAAEEDSSPLRKQLLQMVSERQSQLNGEPLSRIHDFYNLDGSDLYAVMGMMRWVLLPLHKRPVGPYPTRSLKGWIMALVLSELGSIVSAASAVLSDSSVYQARVQAIMNLEGTSSVFLVVTNSGDTDPMMLSDVPVMDHFALRPQPTKLRFVPLLVSRRLERTTSVVDTTFLAEVWSYSFKNARSLFERVQVEIFAVKIWLKSSVNTEPMAELHKALLTAFSPYLRGVCGAAMSRYIPVSTNSGSWQPSVILERVRILGTKDDIEDEVRDHSYTLPAIMLGVMYGICSMACRTDNEMMQEDSEIALAPDLLYYEREKLFGLIRTLGFALHFGVECQLWARLIFTIFLGCDKDASPNDITYRPEMTILNTFANRFVFSVQANGFTTVSALLVKPTIQLSALGCFHIVQGQILNLPLTDDGFIRASAYGPQSLPLVVNRDPENSSSSSLNNNSYTESMRLDVEPCWEDDPRMIIFRLREMGTIIAPLSTELIMNRIALSTTKCSCGNPSLDKAHVDVAEGWQHIRLDQVRRDRLHEGSSARLIDVDHCKALVDASHSEAATAYALGILHTHLLGLPDKCLACVQNYLQSLCGGNYAGATLIILWKPAKDAA